MTAPGNNHVMLLTVSLGAFGFALAQMLTTLRRMRAARAVPEPFTKPTHRAMVAAGRAAGRHCALMPSHVLIGILKTRSVARDVLHDVNTNPRELLRALSRLRPSEDGAAGSLSPEVQRALRAAAAESHTMQSRLVGTSQLLLGILRSASPDLTALLAHHQVTAEAIERKLNAPTTATRVAQELGDTGKASPG